MLVTRIVLTFTATAAALLSSAPAAAAPPLGAYGQLPGISNIEISPDGKMWAAIMGDETQAQIQIRELAGAKLISVTPAERAKVRELWKDAWRVWFPDGPESADLVLVHVRPAVAELWDQRGVHGLRYAWKAVKAYVKEAVAKKAAYEADSDAIQEAAA
jgi:hypothetical protein